MSDTVNSNDPSAIPVEYIEWPQEIEITLKLKFKSPDADSVDYLESIGFVADIFDIICDNLTEELISVNNLTPDQFRNQTAKS